MKPPRSSIAGLSIDLLGGREVEEEEDRRREEEEKRLQADHRRRREEEERRREREINVEVKQGEEVHHRLEETSASLAAAVEAVEHKIKEEDAENE